MSFPAAQIAHLSTDSTSVPSKVTHSMLSLSRTSIYPGCVPQQSNLSVVPRTLYAVKKKQSACRKYNRNGKLTPRQTSDPYTPPVNTTIQQQYQPTAQMQAYGVLLYRNAQPAQQSFLVPSNDASSRQSTISPPPAKKRQEGGWNDALASSSKQRAPSTFPEKKPAATTAPFLSSASSLGPRRGALLAGLPTSSERWKYSK